MPVMNSEGDNGFGQKLKEAVKKKTAAPPKPKADPRYRGLKRRERTKGK